MVNETVTPTQFLRDACRLDPRSTLRIAKDAGMPPPVLYRFVNGERDNLNTVSFDRLAAALDLELVPRRPRAA